MCAFAGKAHMPFALHMSASDPKRTFASALHISTWTGAYTSTHHDLEDIYGSDAHMDFVNSRICSMKRSAIGLSVRSFNVIMAITETLSLKRIGNSFKS